METAGEKRIEVTRCVPGYANTRFEGRCSDDVTVEDIKEKFYHPHFGGRGAFVSNGSFQAIRHDD